jgi:hypothetical protein
MIMSWLDAGDLRNQVYQLQDRLEMARVAMEDIQRMDDVGLMKNLAQRTLEKL